MYLGMQIPLLEGELHSHSLKYRPRASILISIERQAFLLTQTTNTADWSHSLSESRSTYSSLKDHFLRYIKHPEDLTSASDDPLADDADVR